MAQILIVEDNYLTYQLLYYFLRRKNHVVYQASNGMEALSQLKEHKIDLVITDISMPEMDGLTLLDEIRASDRLRKVPVIVLTASGLEHIKQMTMDKGATAFVSQPFSSIELGKIVSECLGAY